jgi:hypothetical protein
VEESSRSELLQRNEQLKAASSLAGNGGLALVAAALGRWFFEGLDGHVILWLLVGSVIISGGLKVLLLFGRRREMNGLNEYAPAIGGAGLLAYIWFTYFRIKRQQAKSRETRAAE